MKNRIIVIAILAIIAFILSIAFRKMEISYNENLRVEMYNEGSVLPEYQYGDQFENKEPIED